MRQIAELPETRHTAGDGTMREPDRFRLAELTKDEFAVAMREGRWVLLPFGTLEAH